MFVKKIENATRADLMAYFVKLYSEGFGCLLKCQSINETLTHIIQSSGRVRLIFNTPDCNASRVALEIIAEFHNLLPLDTDLVY